MSNKIDRIKKNIVALDIGSSSLKLAVGEFNKDNLVIKRSCFVPVPDGIFVNGVLVDVNKLALVLKRALKQNKIKAKNCFCCFDNNQVITRDVTIPAPTKDNLQEMAKFEVEQYLPIEMSNYVVQSIILKELAMDDKPYANMLVTAFPKEEVGKIHSLIELAGLKPMVLDTKANAFSKLIEHQSKINGNDYHREGTVAFLDFGYDKVTVSIFSKGKYKFHRILKVGGVDLDTNIAKFLDINTDEAMAKKMQIKNINYTVDEQSEEARIVNIVRSTMDNWFDEIMKIFRYYTTKTPTNNAIEYIYIHGGSSKIHGMSDFVESFFKVPVENIRKVSSLSFADHAELNVSEGLNTFGVMYRR